MDGHLKERAGQAVCWYVEREWTRHPAGQVPPASSPPAVPADVPAVARTGVPPAAPARESDASPLDRLLDAGLELFGTQGLDHTTVPELCREARVSSQQFRDCVGDRMTLFQMVLVREVGRYANIMLTSTGRVPGQDAASGPRWARAWLDRLFTDPRPYRMILDAARCANPDLDGHSRHRLRELAALALVQFDLSTGPARPAALGPAPGWTACGPGNVGDDALERLLTLVDEHW